MTLIEANRLIEKVGDDLFRLRVAMEEDADPEVREDIKAAFHGYLNTKDIRKTPLCTNPDRAHYGTIVLRKRYGLKDPKPVKCGACGYHWFPNWAKKK